MQTVSALIPKLEKKGSYITATSLIVQLTLLYGPEFTYAPDLSSKNGIRLYTYLALVGKNPFDPLVKALKDTCEIGSVKVLDIVLMWVKDFFPQKRLENTVRATVFQIFTAYYKNVIIVLEKGHKVFNSCF